MMVNRYMKNWNDYNAGCVADTVNQPVLDFLAYNCHCEVAPCDVIFLTGRSEDYRSETHEWLREKFDYKDRYHLLMRDEGDYKPAAQFKMVKLLDFLAVKEIFISDIKAVIDDDESCCDMFSELGIKNVIHYKGD